ncbi:hypothetical protein [Candidatus Bandiella euplotis]|uniref:Uncharacterized protein n=1 Tax=Candidatus Bandiella euplotis TaxID=1664265 RepID=A0ABZ0UR09_9RICK|nr:hypothetical protein [Candidatus Bandiella woodruffii]WPX97153.1 hypothetical protein Bandiella_01297 [Candidatus Bandiella woodruffii]
MCAGHEVRAKGSSPLWAEIERSINLTVPLWVHFEDNNNFLSEQGNFISIFG